MDYHRFPTLSFILNDFLELTFFSEKFDIFSNYSARMVLFFIAENAVTYSRVRIFEKNSLISYSSECTRLIVANGTTDQRCLLLSQSTLVFVTYFDRRCSEPGADTRVSVPRLELELIRLGNRILPSTSRFRSLLALRIK